ncbi:putative non-specific lipid transfer protein GPI-anchored 2 [Cocos nucifera]|uniref:Putative non-specific lipid transfer protein GPI-anchored 2 n=1 Tax=Cocos nucifera TaxID=13894 RepID=A0A8K0ICA7_COCNU|nr:putative non-specific lipid transfer protein GPI-anchored 2 [Cocos nucifera]
MEKIKCFSIAMAILAVILTAPATPVTGQIAEACTVSISRFTPCLKYLLATTIGGNSPMKECCSALEALISLRMDCICLILTGNVPFNFPFNQTLAISIPSMYSDDTSRSRPCPVHTIPSSTTSTSIGAIATFAITIITFGAGISTAAVRGLGGNVWVSSDTFILLDFSIRSSMVKKKKRKQREMVMS